MPGALLGRASLFARPKMLLPPVPYRRARVLVLAAVLLATAVLSLTRGARGASPPAPRLSGGGWMWSGPGPNGTSPRVPPADVAAHLRRLAREQALTGQVTWHARRVRPDFSAARRLSMTETALAFAPGEFHLARAEDPGQWLEPAPPPLVLPVGRSARPGEVDASALLFGVSTSLDRLAYADYAMLGDWARWLTDGAGRSNGARLVLAVHGAGPSDAPQLERRLRAAGVDAEVLLSSDGAGSGPAARYSHLQ